MCSACAITCVFTLLAVSHIQGDTVSFGGFSLREEAKTLIPGSLFQRRDTADSTSVSSVATAAAQAHIASGEAEKKSSNDCTSVTFLIKGFKKAHHR